MIFLLFWRENASHYFRRCAKWRPAALNNSHVLAFVWKAQLNDQQVKSYTQKKGILRNFILYTEEQNKKGQQEQNALDKYVPLLQVQPPWKLASCSYLCYHDFTNIMLKTHLHEKGDSQVASSPLPLSPSLVFLTLSRICKCCVTKVTDTTTCSKGFLHKLVATFSLHVRILGECLTIHSPPALFSFLFLKWRLAYAH